MGVYTLRQYRDVCMRMESFLGMLNPSRCFSVPGTPSAQEWAVLLAAATRNIAFACDFLDAKVASVALIEALAMATGTDCPVSMFLGDIRSAQGRPDRVHDFLPRASPTASTRTCWRFLKTAATWHRKTTWQRHRSRLLCTATWVLMSRKTLRHARDMFAGITTPQAFLQTQNRAMVGAMIQACSHIALSRSAALQELQRALDASPALTPPGA